MCSFRFHSRHIPEELLNFSSDMGLDVRRNGLCDTLSIDSLKRLRDYNIEVIETRLVWWELEPQPGVFDWSRLERDIEKIEHAGMKVGVFPWFQHPPVWYDPQHSQHARLRCLEHGEDSTILSIWDPKTLDVYDRLYGELARRLSSRIDFLYVGITGSYGEVLYPHKVKHYKFSPQHAHNGFWCADRAAWLNYAHWLQQRWRTLDQLNQNWGTNYANWAEVPMMPQRSFAANPLPLRRAFADWYTGSLLHFTDQVCDLVRRHFPNTEAALPIGAFNEPLNMGQIKSAAAKIAAKYRLTARWTGIGGRAGFAVCNIQSRRLASAAWHYGTPFGTEAALIIDKDNAAAGLYEAFANGAAIIHDDPQNIFRASNVHQELRPRYFLSQPQSRVAVFYPLTGEQLKEPATDMKLFIKRAAALREHADYHICDELMISDGFLVQIDDLLFLVTGPIEKNTAEALMQFMDKGGRIWIFDESTIDVLDDFCSFEDLTVARGQKVKRGIELCKGGLHRFTRWPKFEPYHSFKSTLDSTAEGYLTVHKDRISCFFPTSDEIRVWTLDGKSWPERGRADDEE